MNRFVLKTGCCNVCSCCCTAIPSCRGFFPTPFGAKKGLTAKGGRKTMGDSCRPFFFVSCPFSGSP